MIPFWGLDSTADLPEGENFRRRTLKEGDPELVEMRFQE